MAAEILHGFPRIVYGLIHELRDPSAPTFGLFAKIVSQDRLGVKKEMVRMPENLIFLDLPGVF
jgi:hypothetical protein